MSFDAFVEHVVVHYRWIFVMFLLPVSFLYDIYFFARNWIVFRMSSAPKKHLEKVRKVQSQVRAWKASGSDRPMCTARPGKGGKTKPNKCLITPIHTYM